MSNNKSIELGKLKALRDVLRDKGIEISGRGNSGIVIFLTGSDAEFIKILTPLTADFLNGWISACENLNLELAPLEPADLLEPK